MKKYLIAFACASLALVSCNKENLQDSSRIRTFSLVREVPGADTRAALDGNKVIFTAGDAVSVFDGTGNKKFTTTEGGATAAFTGEAADAAQYLVLSPYNENATLQSASVVRITIPEIQTATPGGVDPKALISAGIAGADGTATLYNAVGLVKVIVPDGLEVKNIQIAGGKAATIAIAGQFDFNADTHTLGVVSGKTTQFLTLVPPEGESTIAPGTYYVAVRPKTTYDAGFVIAYVNASNELCKRVTTAAVDIQRSHILPMGTLGAGYTAVSGNAILRAAGDDVQFSGRLKKLAGGSGTANVDDNVIKKIIFKSHTLIPNELKLGTTIVSAGVSTAGCEVYARLDGDVMYVLTEGPKFTINANSGNLFRNFAVLEEVIFDQVTTQSNANFTYMFRNCPKLKKVDFGDADFSQVKDFSFMFVTNNLQEVSFGETSTTSATTMQSMFSQSLNLRRLYLGKNFTLASNITGMFNGTASQTTQTLDEEGHGLQCKLFASQAVWDQLTADLNADGVNATTLFNKNRFYFTPVE